MTVRQISKQAFFDKIGYQPHPQQLLYHTSRARFRLPNCGRRFGKDLSLSTPILTTNGWTTMAAIAVGDFVYGPDGKPTRVVSKSEVLFNDCYEVTFDDGASLIAGAGHEWAIETYTMRKSRGNGRWSVPAYKVMTTEELAARKPKYPDSLMLASSVEMSEQKLAIAPYVYGVWLGDGTTGQAQLTAEVSDAQTYQVEFERLGYGLRDIPSKRQGWKIEGLTRSDCLTKVVPDEYRLGSVEQRLELLRGLMDTDGTVSNEQLQFDNTDRTLVELVAWLVNSLGGKGRFSQHEPCYVKEGEYVYGKTSYRFGFNIALPVFKLQRKLDKQMRLRQGSQTVRRYIKSVRRIETVPTQCIQVAREDGLWLAGAELVVTHNSTMAARDLEPRLFLPDKLFWIVGPTYDLGEKEFRYIWNDLIVGQKLGKDKTIKRAYNKKQGNMFIEFPWGTRVEVRSADHPENLVGDALDWVIMSEAAKHKEETWQRFIQPALADKRGGADFPTTPEGYNWLYKLWMYGQNDTIPEYESWRFPSWANAHVYPEGENDPEIKLLRRTMSPEAFNQEIAADFSSFVGQIFPEWDVTRHVKNIPFQPHLPNYMAIDWGYTNPAAFIEFQVDPQDRVYIWREHYKAYTRVEDHIAEMKRRDQPEGYHLDLAFADAADPEAILTMNQRMVPTIGMPEAKTNWREGIDLVRSFMEREVGEDEFGGPQYEEAFFVDHGCVNTIDEFNNYKAPEGLKGRNAPEGDNKSKNHACDAIRYGLVHLFHLGCGTGLADVIDVNPAMQGGSETTGYSEGDFASSGSGGFFTSGGDF